MLATVMPQTAETGAAAGKTQRRREEAERGGGESTTARVGGGAAEVEQSRKTQEKVPILASVPALIARAFC